MDEDVAAICSTSAIFPQPRWYKYQPRTPASFLIKAVFGSWGLRNARPLALHRKERPPRAAEEGYAQRSARAKTYRRVGRRVKTDRRR